MRVGLSANLGLIGKLPHRRIVTALRGGIGSPASGFEEINIGSVHY